MDAVSDAVNWSAEAAKCFERLLGELASRKQKKDFQDVIARLKASKIEAQDENHKIGFEAGKFWAENLASYSELERAASYELPGGMGSTPWDGAYGAAFELMGLNTEETHREDLEEKAISFWSAALQSENAVWVRDILGRGEDTLLEGFIDGASVVWDQVADKL